MFIETTVSFISIKSYGVFSDQPDLWTIHCAFCTVESNLKDHGGKSRKGGGMDYGDSLKMANGDGCIDSSLCWKPFLMILEKEGRRFHYCAHSIWIQPTGRLFSSHGTPIFLSCLDFKKNLSSVLCLRCQYFELIRRLKPHGLSENTLVIFVGDILNIDIPFFWASWYLSIWWPSWCIFLPILWPCLIPGMEDILAAGKEPAMKLVDEVKREHFGLEDIGKPTSDQQSTVVNLEKKGLSSEQPIFVNAESKIKDNTKGKRLSVNGEAADERPARARGAWVFWLSMGISSVVVLSSFRHRQLRFISFSIFWHQTNICNVIARIHLLNDNYSSSPWLERYPTHFLSNHDTPRGDQKDLVVLSDDPKQLIRSSFLSDFLNLIARSPIPPRAWGRNSLVATRFPKPCEVIQRTNSFLVS